MKRCGQASRTPFLYRNVPVQERSCSVLLSAIRGVGAMLHDHPTAGSAAIRISLHAAAEPAALRVLVQQYADRCGEALSAMLAKHERLRAKGVSTEARCEEELAAAGAAARANVSMLRLLLRLPGGGSQALLDATTRAEEFPGEHYPALALYDDAEQVLLHTARDWAADPDDDKREKEGGVRNQRALVRACITSLLDAPHRGPGSDVTASMTQRRSRVMVLGSGLGRTAFELARAGCDVDALDASIAMTLAATSICERAAAGCAGSVAVLRCHPWLLCPANLHSTGMLISTGLFCHVHRALFFF